MEFSFRIRGCNAFDVREAMLRVLKLRFRAQSARLDDLYRRCGAGGKARKPLVTPGLGVLFLMGGASLIAQELWVAARALDRLEV